MSDTSGRDRDDEAGAWAGVYIFGDDDAGALGSVGGRFRCPSGRTRFSVFSFQSLDAPPRSTSPRAARSSRERVTRSVIRRDRSRSTADGTKERWGRAKGHPRWTKRTPRPSAAIFASRLVELLSRTDEDHRAKIPGQCGGERQPSRAGPSVGRSATSAAEQLAIAQSCDQRGNNPPTQRGLLSTLTSTPQLTKIVNHRLTVFSRDVRGRGRSAVAKPTVCFRTHHHNITGRISFTY